MQTVEVVIIDDDLLEIDEEFQAMLQLNSSRDQSRVNLQPNTTNITILDNDCKIL